MRNLKSRWILALLLVLTLVLAGCGSSEPQGGKVAPVPETAATQPLETEAAEAPLSLGRMEGGTYTNTYAGFACDLDDSWTFYSAEELQDLPESVKNAVEGSDIGEQLEGVVQITDMMAENADLMSNVNVLYNKQDLATRLAFQAISEEGMIDATLEQKDDMIEAYTQAGIQVSSLDKTQLTFLGETRWGLKTVAETQGVPCYILQVFDFKLGTYGVTLTATSFVEDNTQAVLDLFYAVE